MKQNVNNFPDIIIKETLTRDKEKCLEIRKVALLDFVFTNSFIMWSQAQH